jgi:hypothetical protein
MIKSKEISKQEIKGAIEKISKTNRDFCKHSENNDSFGEADGEPM